MIPNFKEIKKQILELWKSLENKILESNKFNALKERYQSLSLLHQKLIKYSIVSFLLIAFLYLPVFYFFSSTALWLEFKSKQKLSWELLKVRQKSSQLNFQSRSENQVKMNLRQTARKYSPEDLNLQETASKKMDFIKRKQFKLQIPHLNIKQAVQLGAELHALNFVRLDGIQFKENKEYPKHYDIDYELSVFLLKEVKRIQEPRKKRVKRKTNRARPSLKEEER